MSSKLRYPDWKGCGHGYQGNQGQQGYYNYQYDQQPGDRNNRQFRGRGANQRGYNHNKMWVNPWRGSHSTVPAPSASTVVSTPMPLPDPTTSSPIIDSNLILGRSLFSRYMSKETFTKALHDQQRFRRTEGSSVKCAKTSCTNWLPTGLGVKFCSACGSNQEVLEVAQYREEISKLQSQM